jgi:hypothetical protein
VWAEGTDDGARAESSGVFFLPHPFNQMVVSKMAVNDRTAPVFAFIPKGWFWLVVLLEGALGDSHDVDAGNLNKLLNVWRNEDRIKLGSCRVIKGGLSIVRAVLSIDNTDEDDRRGGGQIIARQ